ncbi:MAG: sialidase family protein, partial [Halobacteriota archaeon]
MRHINKHLLMSLLGLLLTLLLSPTGVSAQLVVGANVNISNLAGAQSEVGIAVNPMNPQNLVAVSNQLGDLSQLGAWFSTDGGATWTANFIDENEDGFGADDSRFDPNVAFDSDGNVYVVYSSTGTGNRLLLARSTDGGQNFNQVTTVTTDASAASNLHTAMVTTRSDAGAADDVLVVWARVQAGGESIEAALSLDAGATFPTTNNNINDTQERTFLPWASVDAAGDFHVVWEVNQGGGAGTIFHDVLDGTTLADGATDNTVTTVQITDFAEATSRIPAQPDRGIFSVSTVDVDRTSGRVYVAYTDRPNTASNDTDIFVRFSDDSGANWSAPVQVNDNNEATTATSQFMPRLAIAQTTGVVYTTWYDARNDAANNQQVDGFISVSSNGAVNWSANQQLTGARSDESTANATRNVNNYGE